MTTLEQALTSEKILRNRIDKLIDNGKKTAIAKRTAGFYETKITDLKQLWSDYCKADQSVREIILTNQEKDTSGYITEDFFGNTELKYSEYMGELLEGMRKCSPTQEATTGATIGASTGAITAVVREESLLPKIALPKYNGDYDTWRSFHDIFISLVHDNTRLTPVQ